MPEDTTAPATTPAGAALTALLAVVLVPLLCLAVLVAAPAEAGDPAAGPRVVSSAAAVSGDSPAQVPSASAGPVEAADDLPAPLLPDARSASLRTGAPTTSSPAAANLPVAAGTSLPDPD